MTHLKRLIAVFIIVLTAFLIIPKGKAAAGGYMPCGNKDDVFIEDDVNKYRDYTYTTKYLDQLKYNYDEYYGNYMGTWTEESTDKKITNVIPFDMFVRRGTYLHIGLKYGFFVQTQKTMHSDITTNAHYYIDDEYNISEVFIFKINRVVNNVNFKVETQINTVFSGYYAYHYCDYEKTYNLGFLGRESQKDSHSLTSVSYFKNTCSFEENNYKSITSSDESEFSGYIDKKAKYILESVKSGVNTAVDLVFIIASAVTGSVDLMDFIRGLIRTSNTFLIDLIIHILEISDNGNNGGQDSGISLAFETIDLVETITEFLMNIDEFRNSEFGVDLKTYHIAKMIIITIEMVVDLIRNYDGSFLNVQKVYEFVRPYFEDLRTEVVSIIEEYVEEVNPLSSVISMTKDLVLDTIATFVNIFRAINGGYDSYTKHSMSNYVGIEGKRKIQLRPNLEHDSSAKITNYFVACSQSSQNKNDTINCTTTITIFDDSSAAGDYCVNKDKIKEKKYYTITSTMKLKVYDNMKTSDGNYIYLDAPGEDPVTRKLVKTVLNKNVFYTGENNIFKAYFKPTIDGEYNIKITGRNGYYQVSNYQLDIFGSNIALGQLSKNTTYGITIDTFNLNTSVPRPNIDDEHLADLFGKNIYGNYEVSIEISLVSSAIKQKTSFHSSSAGYYYVELYCPYLNSEMAKNIYMNILSIKEERRVALPYCGGVYKYEYQTYYGSCTRVDKRKFKVYLNAASDYYFETSSNYNSTIKIYKA